MRLEYLGLLPLITFIAYIVGKFTYYPSVTGWGEPLSETLGRGFKYVVYAGIILGGIYWFLTLFLVRGS